MQLPKMRTATGVVDELRAVDPNTAVSVHLVRQLINSGAVLMRGMLMRGMLMRERPFFPLQSHRLQRRFSPAGFPAAHGAGFLKN